MLGAPASNYPNNGRYFGSGGSAAAYANLNLSQDDHIMRLQLFSTGCLIISTFFWGWAVLNTFDMKKGFDLGIVSFLLSGSSSLYLFLISRKGSSGFTPPSVITRALVLISHVLVALNYALGAYMALTLQVVYIKFAYYCIIFMILWLGCAVVGWTLVTNVLDIGVEDLDDLHVVYDLQD